MGIQIVFGISLLLFWLVISGPSLSSLVVGIVAIVFITWLNRDLLDSLVEKKWKLKARNLIVLCGYCTSLLWKILLANIQVAKIVLSPKMPLGPVLLRFNPGLKSDLAKTILANSITLTPGTLTIDVQGDVFTVHTLTMSAAQAVVEWPLIATLRQMEENT